MSVNWEMYDEQYASYDAPEKPAGLPDGNYKAVIESMEFGQWDDGSPKISWRYRITEGDHASRVHMSGVGLNQYTKGDLDALGFKGMSISSIVKNASAINGVEVSIRLKTNDKGKQYTYLNKVLSPPVAAASAVAAPVAPVAPPAPATQAALPGVPVTVATPFD